MTVLAGIVAGFIVYAYQDQVKAIIGIEQTPSRLEPPSQEKSEDISVMPLEPDTKISTSIHKEIVNGFMVTSFHCDEMSRNVIMKFEDIGYGDYWPNPSWLDVAFSFPFESGEAWVKKMLDETYLVDENGNVHPLTSDEYVREGSYDRSGGWFSEDNYHDLKPMETFRTRLHFEYFGHYSTKLTLYDHKKHKRLEIEKVK